MLAYLPVLVFSVAVFFFIFSQGFRSLTVLLLQGIGKLLLAVWVLITQVFRVFKIIVIYTMDSIRIIQKKIREEEEEHARKERRKIR
ncbi:hypothetical protein [Candidatus Igneacidithiobacillus taiwanensis]|uniref:hypothetical protein n=1 Tax=Candidatus Igneacidithiobacillus taiwanensis TaxID=1945924 RepID=UPI0028995E10|nr:hypothetical protein [Candidatus Igneacidithiobacillus taiwanensis]